MKHQALMLPKHRGLNGAFGDPDEEIRLGSPESDLESREIRLALKVNVTGRRDFWQIS